MTAHDQSIEKWHDVAFNGGIDRGSQNCALCKEYQTPNSCNGCPVEEYTGHRLCTNTPYSAWTEHQELYHPQDDRSPNEAGWYVHTGCKECRRLAIAEYQFLKSLKEEPS